MIKLVAISNMKILLLQTMRTQEMSTAVLRIKIFWEEILQPLPPQRINQDPTSMTFPVMKKGTSANLFAPTLIRKMTLRGKLYLNKFNIEAAMMQLKHNVNRSLNATSLNPRI